MLALCCSLQSDASELYYHRLPFLITDLTGQSTGYTAVQPCMDTLLYQIEHINETVIALPPAVEVNACHPHLQQDKLQISIMAAYHLAYQGHHDHELSLLDHPCPPPCPGLGKP